MPSFPSQTTPAFPNFNADHSCPLCGQTWIAPYELEFIHGRAFWKGKRLPLPPSESIIFNHLYERRGYPVGAKELFLSLYGLRRDGGPNFPTIKVFVARLRRKLTTYRLPFIILRDGRTAYMLVERRLNYDSRAPKHP